MRFRSALRGVREGQRKAVRLQRRIWLAELAVWPTATFMAILASVAAWAWWQRKSSIAESDGLASGSTSAAPNGSEPPGAGSASGH